MDVILPMSPIFYVLSPDYIRMLLSPVLEYLNDGRWPHNYTIHDMQGRIVLSGVASGPIAILPVDQLGAGSYLVHIAQQYLVATEHLVVR